MVNRTLKIFQKEKYVHTYLKSFGEIPNDFICRPYTSQIQKLDIATRIAGMIRHDSNLNALVVTNASMNSQNQWIYHLKPQNSEKMKMVLLKYFQRKSIWLEFIQHNFHNFLHSTHFHHHVTVVYLKMEMQSHRVNQEGSWVQYRIYNFLENKYQYCGYQCKEFSWRRILHWEKNVVSIITWKFQFTWFCSYNPRRRRYFWHGNFRFFLQKTIFFFFKKWRKNVFFPT